MIELAVSRLIMEKSSGVPYEVSGHSGQHTSADLVPILIRPDEITNVQRAAHAIGRSEKTIRRWCKEYRIARQSSPNSPLDICLPALHMVASGDWSALERLRAGERGHPAVRRYFDHLGIPV